MNCTGCGKPALLALCSTCAPEFQGVDHAKRVGELEAAALALLQASEPGVPETEGMRRASVLAKLVGYEPGPQPELGMGTPRTHHTERMEREVTRLADLLRIEVEQTSPAWSFALFVFETRQDSHNGHVLFISRDRERAMGAIASWMRERFRAAGAKAKG